MPSAGKCAARAARQAERLGALIGYVRVLLENGERINYEVGVDAGQVKLVAWGAESRDARQQERDDRRAADAADAKAKAPDSRSCPTAARSSMRPARGVRPWTNLGCPSQGRRASLRRAPAARATNARPATRARLTSRLR